MLRHTAFNILSILDEVSKVSPEAQAVPSPSEQGSLRHKVAFSYSNSRNFLVVSQRSFCPFLHLCPTGLRKEFIWAGWVNWFLSSKVWLWWILTESSKNWNFWAPRKKFCYSLFLYQRNYLLTGKETYLQSIKSSTLFYALPWHAKSGRKFSRQSALRYYCFSLVMGPQPKF